MTTVNRHARARARGSVHAVVHEAEIPKRRLEAQYELSRILAEATDLETAAPQLLEVVGTRLDCIVSAATALQYASRQGSASGPIQPAMRRPRST